jgi:hypothetical protein
MLRFRIALVCLAMTGCPSAGEQPSRDAVTQDARVRDAQLADAARTPTDTSANQDASEDAGAPEDAAASPFVSWRDVPAGPIPEPRTVCERNWPSARLPGSPIIGLFEDRVMFTNIVADKRGNLFIAGSIAGDQDFGAGIVDVPWTLPAKRPYEAVVLLALDAACNLRWSRALLPSGTDVRRRPMALGFDAQEDLVLVTQSNELEISNLVASYQASSIDIARVDQDGVVLSDVHHPIGVMPLDGQAQARAGEVLISGNADRAEPLDFGAGPLIDARGHDFNALFSADGTLLHAEIGGSPEFQTGLGLQKLGANGELLTFGEALPNYYGSSLLGPTLIKLDRARNVVWKRDLHPASPTASVGYQLAVSDDGAIATIESYRPSYDQPASASFGERDADGNPVWDMPYTTRSVQDDFSLSELVVGSSRSLTTLGSLTGHVTLGNHELVSETNGEPVPVGFVLQLARGGAPRWLKRDSDGVQALTVTPDEEAAVCGFRSDANGGKVLFVRKYGSVAE